MHPICPLLLSAETNPHHSHYLLIQTHSRLGRYIPISSLPLVGCSRHVSRDALWVCGFGEQLVILPVGQFLQLLLVPEKS